MTTNNLLSADKVRSGKAVVEFAPQSASALSSLEVEIGDAEVATDRRRPVTDVALFVSKSGGDAESALSAQDGAAAERGSAHFNVRLFIVAGGHLYKGGRGQCGGWQNDLSRCASSCDGSAFALRRNGAADLELLLGAIPGGEAGAGSGLTINPCGFEEGGDVKLVAKTNRGLAVAGFARD